MFDKAILEAQDVNNYEEYQKRREELGGFVHPLPAWLCKLGEYYYAKTKYPHVTIEDALVLVQRDISQAFYAMRSADSSCCGGGEVK